MARPRGSKDKQKRKERKIFSGAEERMMVKDYEDGVRPSIIRKKYGISKSAFWNMLKTRNVAPLVSHADIKEWEKIDEEKDKDMSGIYAICFVPKEAEIINHIRIYIGSSHDVCSRKKTHYYLLNNGKHKNTTMQRDFVEGNYNVGFYLVEQVEEDKLLEREQFYLHRWNNICLYNQWKQEYINELLPYLNKAIKSKGYTERFEYSETNSYEGTPCKESIRIEKSGYGELKVTIDGKAKYFRKHRIAYWEKTGEYPHLIRHKCNNPKCYNPDHLESGSHKQNSADKVVDFISEFKEKWKEFDGDKIKINAHFGWKGNLKIKEGLVSAQVYRWKRKLNLK
jgi:hypothetical protein